MDQQSLIDLLRSGKDTWNAWRSENPNVRVDLSRTVLIDGTLSRSDYQGIDFSGVDLSQAQILRLELSDANFRGALLKGAYIARADLSRADFSDADLTDITIKVNATFESAIFKNANLAGMRIHGSYYTQAPADFRNADFRGAVLTGVDLDYCNVSGARGIHRVREILAKAWESFPVTFGQEVTDLQAVPGQEYHSCFISYSHADQEFADKLYSSLTARGVPCWLDDHKVLPGDDIYDAIHKGIREYDKLLLCCSRASLTSWWVDNEVALAFEREQELWRSNNGEKPLIIIPLNLDGFLFSPEMQNAKVARVRSRAAANFSGWKTSRAKYQAAFAKLSAALHLRGPP